MADIVNKIELTYVQTQVKDDGTGYRIIADWRLNDGAKCGYRDKYHMWFYEDGELKETVDITDESGMHRGEADFFVSSRKGTEEDPVCELQIGTPKEAGGIVSNLLSLIVDTYQNVRGTYEGSKLKLGWDRQSPQISEGLCSISIGDKTKYTRRIEPYMARMEVGDLYLQDGDVFTVTLYPREEKSQGPVSEALTFYTIAPKLESADYSRTAEGSRVTAKLSVPYACTGCLLTLKAGGRNLYSEVKALQPPDEGAAGTAADFIMDIPESTVSYDSIGRCVLTVSSTSGRAVSCIEGEKNTIPLAKPVVSARASSDRISLDWRYPKEYIPCTFLVRHKGGDITVTEPHYEGDFAVGDSIRIAAQFPKEEGSAAGSFSERVTGFQTAYYPVRDAEGSCSLVYRKADFEEKQLSMSLEKMLFSFTKETDIGSGPIHLKGSGTSYILTVLTASAVSRAQYDDFIGKLQDDITPGGFYTLTRILARMINQSYADSTYFLCGYSPERRSADIRPGLLVSVQAENYQFQPDLSGKIGGPQGYAASDTSLYVPFWNEQKGYLVFDSFIDGIASVMEMPDLGDSHVIEAGGICDLCLLPARKPYYSVMFPTEFTLSGDIQSMYLSDNTGLLAADSYGLLRKSIESILENPSAALQPGIPAVVFRGRSSISLLTEVYVNKRAVLVPVGTTFGQLLQRMAAAPENRKIRLYRRDAWGEEVPVLWNWIAGAEDIPLMNGDRIEA